MYSSGQEIEEDLKWREDELASLKLLLSDLEPGSTRRHGLLRALCALLYAHYEGFCKFAWDYYFDSLEKTRVSRRDCVDRIAIISLQKDFQDMRKDLSPDAIWDFCTNRFPSLLQERLTFNLKLETNANLWPSLLIENSASVGLGCSAARNHAVKLKSLVARRNEIAHGQKMTISNLAEYQEYEHAAVLVMHELAALESKSHLLSFPISPKID